MSNPADVSRTPAPDVEAPRLAPGTYELTKRVEVDEDRLARFVDMPDGPGAEYVKGFWHKTRSQVRKIDPGRVSVSPITDDMVLMAARAIAATSFTNEFGESKNKHMMLACAALSAALAGCTVAEAPELIEMPTFAGCTDSDPMNCACGESPICCAACGDPIEDGARAWSFRFIGCPWEADNSPEQEWGDVFWHEHCDRRNVPASGSLVGEHHG